MPLGRSLPNLAFETVERCPDLSADSRIRSLAQVTRWRIRQPGNLWIGQVANPSVGQLANRPLGQAIRLGTSASGSIRPNRKQQVEWLPPAWAP